MYLKERKRCKPMHNQCSHLLSVERHSRWRGDLKVQIHHSWSRFQHLASKIIWSAKLGVFAKIGAFTLYISAFLFRLYFAAGKGKIQNKTTPEMSCVYGKADIASTLLILENNPNITVND